MSHSLGYSLLGIGYSAPATQRLPPPPTPSLAYPVQRRTLFFVNKRPQEKLRDAAVEVTHRLQSAGFTAYWAGGCVRDMIMGRRPVDYDIATSARPEQVQAVFPGAKLVGKAFGVALVHRDAADFEVATFRTDHAYKDGRHPEHVTFSNPERDAKRRDFTINALFFDPITETIFDFVGGRKDLAQQRIRTVGSPARRFAEDHLRMLRAVRFAATLDFTIDPATKTAIQRHAAKLAQISPERIAQELTRLLLEAKAAGEALVLLDEVGLLAVILPEVAAMKGQEQPVRFHPEGDVFRHTVLLLNLCDQRDPILTYAALLHDIGKPATARTDENGRVRFNRHAAHGETLTRQILARLRFPTAQIDAIAHCVGNHMRFMDVQKMRRATLRKLVGAPTFATELALHRLDCLASHGKMDNFEFLQKTLQEFESEPVMPPPWISGRDIMALGVAQGPLVGKWKKRAYDMQLEGEAASREDLLAWLQKEIAREARRS